MRPRAQPTSSGACPLALAALAAVHTRSLMSPAVQQHAALCARGHPRWRPLPGQDQHRCGGHEGKRLHPQGRTKGGEQQEGPTVTQSRNPGAAGLGQCEGGKDEA